MKKILSLILVCIFLFSFCGLAVYAEDESESETPSEAVTTSPMPPVRNRPPFTDMIIGSLKTEVGLGSSAPQWVSVANVSTTFVISANGKASVLYTVSSKSNSSGIKVTYYLERRVAGLVWKRVDIGVKDNEWNDSTGGKYLSGSRSVRLSEYGKYRVVFKITCGGDTITRTHEFKYAEGYVPGDANGNGELTASDARQILRVSAKLAKFSTKQTELCDINGDGIITASDARLALRMSAKLL